MERKSERLLSRASSDDKEDGQTVVPLEAHRHARSAGMEAPAAASTSLHPSCSTRMATKEVPRTFSRTVRDESPECANGPAAAPTSLMPSTLQQPLPLGSSSSPSPSAAPADAISILLPSSRRHSGVDGLKWWLQLVCLILLFAAACVGVATGLICWASDLNAFCPSSAIAVPLATDSLERLLDTSLLLTSLIIGAWAGRAAASRVNRRVADAAMRARVAKEFSGVTTRADATQMLMSGLRDVMELVHDPALQVSLTFEALSYKLRNGTEIVSDATGEVRSGEITVVMGPSGCGKSTLISLLAGKLTPRSGRMFINGQPGSARDVHKLIAFVPQDDVLLSSLSVQELFWFSARLRLPAAMPQHQVGAWVQKVIDLLALTSHRDSVVGDASRRGLSGGQRKRVNIGVEIVADPSLIFLDEPTSGLDSTAALELMRSLDKLASFGVAVCAVLHQPRLQVFKLAHKTLLLDPSGRTVYMGATLSVVVHFERLGFIFDVRENTADQLLDAIAGALQPSAPVDLAAAWKAQLAGSNSQQLSQVSAHASQVSQVQRRIRHRGGRLTPSSCRQLRLFTWRAARQLSRDAAASCRNMLIGCVAGVLLGFLYEGTFEKAVCTPPSLIADSAAWRESCLRHVASAGSFRRGHVLCWGGAQDVRQFADASTQYTQALSLTLLAVAIISVQVALNLFGAEREVFWRESRHYSVFAYLVGKNVAHLPLTLFYPFVFLLCFYPFLRPYAPFQAFYVVLALSQWAGEGLGQLISLQLTASRQLAGGVAALLATVLTGSFPLLSQLPAPFVALSYASFSRWAMQALVALEYFPWYYGDPHLVLAPHSSDDVDEPRNSSMQKKPALEDARCCNMYPLVSGEWPPDIYDCTYSIRPGSPERVAELVGREYKYTILPPWPRHGETYVGDDGRRAPLPDIPAADEFLYGTPQAALALVCIGLLLRALVYASLVLKDRGQRR